MHALVTALGDEELAHYAALVLRQAPDEIKVLAWLQLANLDENDQDELIDEPVEETTA